MLNQTKNLRKMHLSISQTRFQRSQTVSTRFLDKSFLLSPAGVNTEYRTKDLAAHYIVELPCFVNTECQTSTEIIKKGINLAIVKFEADLFRLEVVAEWDKEELVHVAVGMQGNQQFKCLFLLCLEEGVGLVQQEPPQHFFSAS